jgi:hypothetical protein
MRLADRWKVAAEETMSPEEFKKLLEGQLKPNGRFIEVSVTKPLHNEQLVFVTLINLPEELGKKRDVEGMNNRLQISIDLTRPKVKVEQMSSVLPREFKLRGKSGTPAQIAKHVADFLNKVVQEVPPKYTHTKVASKVASSQADDVAEWKRVFQADERALVRYKKELATLEDGRYGTAEEEELVKVKKIIDSLEECISSRRKLLYRTMSFKSAADSDRNEDPGKPSWKVTAASSMKADSWYHQKAGEGRDLWFLAKSEQKNEGWAGVQVEWMKKNPSAKKSSVPKAFMRLWKELPDSEVPSEVKGAAK